MSGKREIILKLSIFAICILVIITISVCINKKSPKHSAYKIQQNNTDYQELPNKKQTPAQKSSEKSLKITNDNMAPMCEGQIVKHKYYKLCYDEKHEQAYWVMYTLKPWMLNNKKAERGNNFRADASVSTGSATPADYKEPIFDQGHLCPAGDMNFDQTAIDETFYMSNMSPQYPKFNRGTWKKAEENVRNWATDYDSVLVITGPIFTSKTTSTIGRNKVGVANYFYKAILAYLGNQLRAAAFLMPHSENLGNANQYLVSIDSLENFTKWNFFEGLPDDKETAVEKNAWNFNKN